MRQYFWLNGEILQNKYFQYFDRSKMRHGRGKIGLVGQCDRPQFKNYFEPCTGELEFLGGDVPGWDPGALEPLVYDYTRASSGEFCYPVLVKSKLLKSLLSLTSCFPETYF